MNCHQEVVDVVYSELGRLSSLIIISDVFVDELTQLGACEFLQSSALHQSQTVSAHLSLVNIASDLAWPYTSCRGLSRTLQLRC